MHVLQLKVPMFKSPQLLSGAKVGILPTGMLNRWCILTLQNSKNPSILLIQLGILPLMYLFELSDITFFIKSVKYPSDKFNNLDYAEFNTSSTRSAKQKLRHKKANINLIMNPYFYSLPRLWNSLHILDLSCSLAVIKFKLKAYF